MNATPILVAGIGNIFLGDDAFGVEVVKRLTAKRHAGGGRRPYQHGARSARPRPGVEVVDFGIRGLDLAYALLDKRSILSMRIVGQHVITETVLGIAIAILTVASIGLGFIAGHSDFRRYLRMKRL